MTFLTFYFPSLFFFFFWSERQLSCGSYTGGVHVRWPDVCTTCAFCQSNSIYLCVWERQTDRERVEREQRSSIELWGKWWNVKGISHQMLKNNWEAWSMWHVSVLVLLVCLAIGGSSQSAPSATEQIAIYCRRTRIKICLSVFISFSNEKMWLQKSRWEIGDWEDCRRV